MNYFNIKKHLSVYNLVSLTLLLYCLALSLKMYKGSSFGSILLMYGANQNHIAILEMTTIVVVLFLTMYTIFQPNWYNAGLLIILLTAISYSTFLAGGNHSLELSFISSISKILLPVIVLHTARSTMRSPAVVEFNASNSLKWSIRLFAALIFISHGFIAIQHNPKFVDYILITSHQISGVFLSETTAKVILTFIGIFDLILGSALLFLNKRIIWIWIVFWGLATALVRINVGGLYNINEFILRSSHFLIPLVYLILHPKNPKIHSQSEIEFIPKEK